MAIDGHGWLHRIAVRHAEQLVIHANATPIVEDFLAEAQLLNDYGILTTFVFDGEANSGKASTTDTRRSSREAAAARAAQGPEGRPEEE